MNLEELKSRVLEKVASEEKKEEKKESWWDKYKTPLLVTGGLGAAGLAGLAGLTLGSKIITRNTNPYLQGYTAEELQKSINDTTRQLGPLGVYNYKLAVKTNTHLMRKLEQLKEARDNQLGLLE